jgi:hypothetical protein
MRAHAIAVGLSVVVALAACGSEDDPDPGASQSSTSGSGASAASSGGGADGGASVASSAQAGGAGGGATTGGAGGGGGDAPSVDLDGDGLDDADEAALAAAYLPYLSVDPEDGCALGGIVYRIYPHPDDAAMLHVIYDHLFETDCGLGGHVGDNEVFGATIDPALPPPAGILALRGISHQDTFCEVISECGAACGYEACATKDVGGKAMPVVFSSRDKHATYVLESKCQSFTGCFDTCGLAETAPERPMINAGEPEAHLVEDLTDDGFITRANGWSEQTLFHYNPWDPTTEFGSAGVVADDLVDPAFLTPACP